MGLTAVLATACGGDSQESSADFPSPVPDSRADAGPVVEVVPTATALPPLDPNADPRTPLGELRARYLPIWSPDFDWAFPPEVCGSDWALDAIAQPTLTADVAVLGDPMAAAALSVMRFEFLLSRASATPDVREQLCIAVASVDPARADALELLSDHLRRDLAGAAPIGFPVEVTIVAATPTAVLAVACAPRGSASDPDGQVEMDDGGSARATLSAYRLTVTRGLEDTVVDISYRVSSVTNRPARSCDEFDSWSAEWQGHAVDWAAQGELWAAVGRSGTAGELCETPPPGGPKECPRDWMR